ncbi:amidohydrolase family protein [Paraburkholderia xenovorans LB400]|uniref:Hydrolase n=1 Tax=Paraburkholderia xenovorans (strain LB400) TaxID=266265 RepID=Q13GZ1_PARXL|nr:amidohydrolase family protein [Paraburkholderia xenovorans]ABE36648.1 Putative hydrolase [Paraburkholderia xenovorans LB400]AIP34368.1 amidohydrolase family protein [Paraburkholderia xenovorans LB400]
MENQEFDIAFTHATLLTGDPAQRELRDATLAVAKGQIAWLGPDLPEHARCKRIIDARGKVITPGFVNVHTHSILTMVRGVAADLGFAPSYTPGIPKGTQVSPEQARVLARLGALEALMFGSTLIGDNFVYADLTTEAMADLGMRLTPSWRIHDVDFTKVADGRWEYSTRIGAQLLQAGLDLADRWKDHPLVNVQLAAHAVDTCSDAFLREIAHASRERGLRVNTHLGQSRLEVERVRERTGKTSTEVLNDVGLLNERLLGGHCIYVTDSDIALMAGAGAHAVHIPKCNATSGRLAPTPKIKRAGINLALATDTQHGDMVELMRWALMTARVQEGAVNSDWQPQHAFHMATLGGANAVGMADRIGSLETGKDADLVMFDFGRPHLTPRTNALGTLVHTGQGRDVEMVMVNGSILVEGGRPTRVDMDEICAEAEQVCEALWRDAH